jgi:hypothetical protein
MNDKKTSNFDEELSENGIEFDDIDDKERNHRKKLTKLQRQIIWRRQAIFKLMITGMSNTYELADHMKISQSTAFRDVQYLKEQATKELRYHVAERLPWQYKISVEGINEIIRYAWSLIVDDSTKQNKIAILALLANSYKDLLEITTSGSVVTEALQQLEKIKHQRQQQQQTTTNKVDEQQ